MGISFCRKTSVTWYDDLIRTGVWATVVLVGLYFEPYTSAQ